MFRWKEERVQRPCSGSKHGGLKKPKQGLWLDFNEWGERAGDMVRQVGGQGSICGAW